MDNIFKAILFDLDNTLIRFNEDEFFTRCMGLMDLLFGEYVSLKDFTKAIFDVSKEMIYKNGDLNNSDFYLKGLSSRLPLSFDLLKSLFREFEDNHFNTLSSIVIVPENLPEIFDGFKKKGYKLVIASNPIWTNGFQVKRMEWAGLGDIPFDLVTHSDNMHYVKPRKEYYEEIAKHIDIPPSQCLMVGNDPIFDISAKLTGMTTFLIEDQYQYDSSYSREVQANLGFPQVKPDYSGSLDRFFSFLGV